MACKEISLWTKLPAPVKPHRGTIIINGNAPEGASFGFTQRYASQAEELLAQVPELRSYLMIVGSGDVTQFLSFARLKDWSERDVKQQQVVQQQEYWPVKF